MPVSYCDVAACTPAFPPEARPGATGSGRFSSCPALLLLASCHRKSGADPMTIYSQHKVSDQNTATTQCFAPDSRGAIDFSNSSAVGTEEWQRAPEARVVGATSSRPLLGIQYSLKSRSSITSPCGGGQEHRGQFNCILGPYPSFSSSLQPRSSRFRRRPLAGEACCVESRST